VADADGELARQYLADELEVEMPRRPARCVLNKSTRNFGPPPTRAIRITRANRSSPATPSPTP
jgi:hypothetical protein